MTNNSTDYVFAPIYITDIKYESSPVYTMGSHSPLEYNIGSVSGGFKALDPDSIGAVMSSVKANTNLYLVNTSNIVDVIREFEDNLPKYLTSPSEGDRLLAQAIARLKGFGNQSNKKESLPHSENETQKESYSE